MILFSNLSVAAAAGAVGAGALLTLSARLWEVTSARLALREAQVRTLAVAFYLALVLGFPVAGILTAQSGASGMLSTGLLLATVAMVLLAHSRGFGMALGTVLVLGAGCACAWTASTVLMPAAFAPNHPTVGLHIGFAFLGLGLLMGPRLAEVVLSWLDGRRGLESLALLFLLPALLIAVTDTEALPAADPNAAELGLLHRPDFCLVAAALVFYLPVELALASWVPRYLLEAGHPERRVAWLYAGFWLALLAGRLGAVLRPTWGPWLILLFALLAGVVLGNLTGARGRRVPVLALLGVGALLGPILPALIGLLFERFPVAAWGTALGGAMGVGSVGTSLLFLLLNGYARRTTARQAFWLLVVSLLLVMLVLLALAIARTLKMTG